MNAAATMLAVMVMNSFIFMLGTIGKRPGGRSNIFRGTRGNHQHPRSKFPLKQPVGCLGLVNKV